MTSRNARGPLSQRRPRVRVIVLPGVLVAAALGWFILSGAPSELGKEPPINVGNRGARPGGGFTLSVSNEFHRPELEALLMRAWVAWSERSAAELQ